MNNDNEEMSIAFDENGQPIADGSAEAEHKPHKSGGKELKEKIVGLELDIEILKGGLENERKEKESFISLAQRGKAEFENFKKRSAEDMRRLREDGLADGIMKVLPVYDALSKAAAMIKDNNTLKGVTMVLQRLDETLKESGVEKIEALGQDFDPALHNAIMNEPAQDEALKNKVTEVFQDGFKRGGRVLRYAMVKVAI